MGFPLIACPGILAAAHRWDRLTIDWEKDLVCFDDGRSLPFSPLALADRSMLEFGGLTGYLKHRATSSRAA